MTWQKTRREWYEIKAYGRGSNVLEEKGRSTLLGAKNEGCLMRRKYPLSKVFIFTYTGVFMEVTDKTRCVLKR